MAATSSKSVILRGFHFRCDGVALHVGQSTPLMNPTLLGIGNLRPAPDIVDTVEVDDHLADDFTVDFDIGALMP